MIPIKNSIQADVAIVGGGIGGLMAAIAAADAGARDIVVLEKAHARRSGSGATGNDHFMCYIPEEHGDSIEPVLAQVLNRVPGMHKDPSLVRAMLEESFYLVRLWQSWGIDMRPYGEKWLFQGHALPGRMKPFLKYNGQNQKKILLREAAKRNIRVLNHHPVMELAVHNGHITGLLALDMGADEPAFTLVKSPAVLLATGVSHRLYSNAPTPAFMFNTAHCPNNAGGQALGWRAGAAMVNMELPYTHAGPKNFQRCGKATWIGVCRYPDGRPLGPFTDRSNVEYGDVTSDIWNTAFTDVLKNGSGPAYMDCSDASGEDLAHMRRAMKDEGLTALLSYMDEKNIDPARRGVEFMRYEPILHGRGLDVDINGETATKGLFAAGDMVGNGCPGIGFAAWLGWRGGKQAAKYGQTRDSLPDPAANDAILAKIDLLSSFHSRKKGAPWQEANFALQRIMDDYAAVGPHGIRSESLLNAGLAYLANLRAETESALMADCSHTLMRAAEVLDLMDCGEVLLHAARERKESRGAHVRSDYAFTNPLLADKLLTLRKIGPEIVVKWREKF